MNTLQKLSALVQERGLYGDYKDLGDIYTKVSPEGDLILFNYSPLAMIRNQWNEYERISRGLVFDAKGNIIALPFAKFFNLDQMPETSSERVLSVGIEYITEKMDGSLGILYWWNDQWRIITRGSFTSDQSQKAYELLEKYDLSRLSKSATYLLEIVYKENRVVLSYDEEFLALLAVFDNITGFEYSYGFVQLSAEDAGFKLPKVYPPLSLDKILEMRNETKGVEGWVLSLLDGSRVKVKTEEYLTLHRAVSNITPKNLLEVYRINQDIDAVASGYPDEFRDLVLEILNGFKKRYYEILHAASNDYLDICHLADNRRAFAEEAKKSKWRGLLFAALDKRNLVPMIFDVMEKEL